MTYDEALRRIELAIYVAECAPGDSIDDPALIAR